jgi:hypothetical protein
MQQYLLMIKFALQPAHNGIANLTTIAQVDDGLARGSVGIMACATTGTTDMVASTITLPAD